MNKGVPKICKDEKSRKNIFAFNTEVCEGGKVW